MLHSPSHRHLFATHDRTSAACSAAIPMLCHLPLVSLYENQPINLLVRPRRPHAVRRRGLLLQTTDVAWSECVGPSQPRAKTDEPIKMPSAWEADSRNRLSDGGSHSHENSGGGTFGGTSADPMPTEMYREI